MMPDRLIGMAFVAVGTAFLAAGAVKLAESDVKARELKKADDTWTEVTADAG